MLPNILLQTFNKSILITGTGDNQSVLKSIKKTGDTEYTNLVYAAV